MLHQCRVHSPYQVQFSYRCCQPLRSPRPLTSGTSITGMATASYPAIISRPTRAFQFMVRRDQSAALQIMRQATGIMAGGTISAILGFSMDATTAAVSARAGLGRPSGRCGIVGRSQQKVWPTDGQHIACYCRGLMSDFENFGLNSPRLSGIAFASRCSLASSGKYLSGCSTVLKRKVFSPSLLK